MEDDHKLGLDTLWEFLETTSGTDDVSLYLHALIRMQQPKTIVELGTGFGTAAFWMALAAKHNGGGIVYTVDDLAVFDQHPELVASTVSFLAAANLGKLTANNASQYFDEVRKSLGLERFLKFIFQRMDLRDPNHFDDYPFHEDDIDLLFADFHHGDEDILDLLGHFLPRMSAVSSLLIRSSPPTITSYLLLERIVTLLNAGRIPLALAERCRNDLLPIARTRRFTMIHLTEPTKGVQSGVAWLKIEPVDLRPHPKSTWSA
jgi:hypothetical protein